MTRREFPEPTTPPLPPLPPSRRPGYDIYGQPTRIDPRDYPDPLTVEPLPPQWRPPAVPATGHGPELEPRRFGCSVFALVLVLALTLAAPRNAPDTPAHSGAPYQTAPYAVEKFGGSSNMAGGAPQPRTEASVPSPSGETSAISAGWASWYPASGDVGAVPWWRAGQDPVWASVCAFEEHTVCVTVLITGFCACLQGQPGERLIDLSEHAFAQLAPLSRGVIKVQMEVGTAGPGLPATDMKEAP